MSPERHKMTALSALRKLLGRLQLRLPYRDFLADLGRRFSDSWQQRLLAVAMLGLFLGYGYYSQDIYLDLWAQEEALNARAFPQLIALCGLVVSLPLLIKPSKEAIAFKALRWKQPLALVALMFAYAALLEVLGFIPTTASFLAGGALLLGERKVSRLLLVCLGLTISFYLLMSALDIRLTPGGWWEGLAR